MSSYHEDTINPRTGKVHRALWMDDYFGEHIYGVRFEGETHVYRAKEVRTLAMEASPKVGDVQP